MATESERSESADAGGSDHVLSRLSAHKIVLPAEVLKDIDDADGKRCLDNDSSDGFFYIPNFISEAEETHLINRIQSAPQPKWRSLQARSGQTIGRLQNWGGQVNKQVLIPEPLPEFLTTFPNLIQRLRETDIFAASKHGQPNHCLMNEYEPGQGIMPHEDGGAYFPVVATISLAGHTLLDIYRYAQESGQEAAPQTEAPTAKAREAHPRFSILQEPRSLLITSGAAYRHFLHGIAERASDDKAQLANVTNGDMLASADLSERVRRAKSPDESVEPLPRTLRLSLTLRDVERVASQSILSMFSKR